MESDQNPNEQVQPDALSQEARKEISGKLERTWEKYIDAIHQFIKLNTSVIVGLAAFVFFLPRLHGTGETLGLLESKRILFWGFFLLMLSLLCEVAIRIWAQVFMEYEVMQPTEDVEKYFARRPHFTLTYRLGKHYKWQIIVVRSLTAIAPLSFLTGLSLSLVFIYRNLR